MRPAFFDNPEYRKKQARIVHLIWQKGAYSFLVKRERRKCLNISCNKYFVVPPSDKQKYCSQDCWYFVRRGHRRKSPPPCKTCGVLVIQRNAFKFCSLKCQAKNSYNNYIFLCKEGIESGTIGVTTFYLSGYIKRYLREKYKERCSRCGWNTKHPITNKVPLEINHIDGNSENNNENNLELICPNCHSLTPNYRALNKGKGRKWRLDKIHASAVINS